ncbi:kinesin-like protein KIF20A isoform X2 [Corythoichthys intestinalis]|uniref:kinesin-like protein KIF20A isoform X2 n=1 Tax=Corythoichthys intestinalis TaxID=161448 RepID=UPI0025A68177|nr:kinesin-like protein KIF20A isoform X2 [Corythoichthys intestinalis]
MFRESSSTRKTNMESVDMDLTCISSTQEETLREPDQQTIKVYLRVRPFSKEELSDNEDQGCVVIENDQMVTLQAPKGSATLKSSEKGVGTSVHKFSFSKIFGPETTQAELYDHTVSSQMSDFLDGKNVLIFSYGVTNAGKTFTMQGTSKEPGILPRVLDATFQYIRGRQYWGMDVKPYLRNDTRCLDIDQVKQEKSVKAAILALFKEECDPMRTHSGSDLSCLSSLSDTTVEESCQFALWLGFFEIYNEYVYDLFQPSFCSKSKKRAALRVCDDGAGNAYVKDLRWINVLSLSEASKLLQYGNKNRSAAATKINQSSSRSHAIFTMKLLKVESNAVKWISEFSLCDLAGSERCNTTKTFGERLKEAGNINNSLLTLGKCIMALRSNQTERMKSISIPFRESKLTKLFQAVFCGKGRASMIVNVNQCASTYDETLHVMKFSAVAKQVVQVIPDKPLESLSRCLVGPNGKSLVRNGMMDREALESFLSEDELLNEDTDADMSLLTQNELVDTIESLRTKLLAERRRNLEQEIEIRKEMGDAMLQQIMKSQELHSQQIEELKESYQEKMENTFEMYKDAIKEHAYKSAMSNLEDDYVPLDKFIAEQEKVEALKLQLSKLASGTRIGNIAPVDVSCQSYQPLKDFEAEGKERFNHLCMEKSALERICEDKQQLIVSLEKRLTEVSETLQKVRDHSLEKSAELEALHVKNKDQEMIHQSLEKDKEIASLKAEISTLTAKLTLQPGTKKSFFANIREVVTPPRSSESWKLRKTTKTPRQ